MIVRLCSNGEYWQARWVLPGGRRVSRSIGHKSEYSRRAAEIECAKIQREVENSTNVRLGNKAPRLHAFLDEYVSSRTNLADTSIDLLGLVVKRLKAYFTADPRIDAITPAHAEAFRHWVATTKFKQNKTERTLSEASVRRYIIVSRQMFAHAVRIEQTSRNPFTAVKVPVVRSDKRWAYIDDATLGRIMEACPSDAWRSAFALARWAGLRLGEIRRLAWGHIDWDSRMLTVVNHGQRQTTKKRTRSLPIQPALLERLRAHYDAVGDGDAGPCASLPEDNVYRRIEAIMEKAKVETYKDPFHTLRRNLLTDWIAVYPPMDVATWLGHDIEVAMEFYHQPKPETVARVTGVPQPEKEPKNVEA